MPVQISGLFNDEQFKEDVITHLNSDLRFLVSLYERKEKTIFRPFIFYGTEYYLKFDVEDETLFVYPYLKNEEERFLFELGRFEFEGGEVEKTFRKMNIDTMQNPDPEFYGLFCDGRFRDEFICALTEDKVKGDVFKGGKQSFLMRVYPKMPLMVEIEKWTNENNVQFVTIELFVGLVEVGKAVYSAEEYKFIFEVEN